MSGRKTPQKGRWRVVDFSLHDVVAVRRPVLTHWRDHGDDYWELEIEVVVRLYETGRIHLFAKSDAAFADIPNPWRRTAGADWPKTEVPA